MRSDQPIDTRNVQRTLIKLCKILSISYLTLYVLDYLNTIRDILLVTTMEAIPVGAIIGIFVYFVAVAFIANINDKQ